jgi:hypothetical protein
MIHDVAWARLESQQIVSPITTASLLAWFMTSTFLQGNFNMGSLARSIGLLGGIGLPGALRAMAS